jgi:hypothetical protein
MRYFGISCTFSRFQKNILKTLQIVIIWYLCKKKNCYVLSAQQVGVVKSTLLHAGLSGGGTVITKKGNHQAIQPHSWA